MKRALICGVGGQDGAYLAKLLLSKNYHVIGSSRDARSSAFSNLVRLGIRDKVVTISMAPTDFRSVFQAIQEHRPDEIYNLSGQTSVGVSFGQPVTTMESISHATLSLLEAIRMTPWPVRFYNAGSSECFGNTDGQPADERTPFFPRSPYAVAKAAAHWQVANYREAYDIHASTGFLFNHESPLRPKHFVTQKIVRGAIDIANKRQRRLHLGNLNIHRDWGWAPEYVDAMWRMLQQESPGDYVIATGYTYSLQDFVETTFSTLNMDWRDYVESDRTLFRPTELESNFANPSKALSVLDWKATITMPQVVKNMVSSALRDNEA